MNDTAFKVAILLLAAVACILLALFDLFMVGMLSDTGVKWWTSFLAILTVGVPACLAFFALRHALRLERTTLQRNGHLADQRSEQRRQRRPVSRQELLTAALALGVLIALIFVLRDSTSPP